MSEFRKAVQHHIEQEFRARPTTVTGKIIDFDHATGLATVEAMNPSGPGLVKFVDRPIPQVMPGISPPAVAIGSIVNLTLPGGNLRFAQIVSIKPPLEDYSSYRDGIARNREFMPLLNRTCF